MSGVSPDHGSSDGDLAPDEGALTALKELLEQLEQSINELRIAAERAHHITASRAAGQTWLDIVGDEQRPLVIERISRVLQDLGRCGNRLRQEQARALMNEDLTITQISKLFGVTRQRVSELVHQSQRA